MELKMWILVTLILVAIFLLISSVEISKAQCRFYEDTEKIVPFIKAFGVQLIVSSIVMFAAGYLLIELDRVTAIRNTTNNTPDFFRALLDGILYVVGLLFLGYGYAQYKSDFDTDR